MFLNTTLINGTLAAEENLNSCPAKSLNCGKVPFYYEFENLSFWNVVAVATFNFIASPFTFFFNFLTLYTVYRRRKLRSMSNLILCNLAATDMMTGILTQPFFGTLMLNSAFCRKFCYVNTFTIFIGNWLSSVSVASLFLITLDRHLSIFHPFYYVKIKESHIKLIVVIGIIWLANLAMVLGSFATPDLALTSIVSSTVALGIFFWSLYVNIRTAFVVKKIRKEIESQTANRQKENGDNSRSEMTSRVTRVAFTILGSMFVCYMPFVIFTVVETRVELPFNAWIWISTLVFLNSLINPLVYCFQMKEIREEIKVVVYRVFCCRTIIIIRDRLTSVAGRSVLQPNRQQTITDANFVQRN